MEITLEALLKQELHDKVIIFQTDTVYGLGCLLESEKGIEKIFKLKGRDSDKPLAVLCASMVDIEALSIDGEHLEKIAKKHWPGALTCVVEKTVLVPDFVTRGLKTVGLRIPDDNVALQILAHFGPMAVTSLNLSSDPPVLTYADALTFGDRVDYIVKGVDLDAIVSTVYDVRNKKILRQGSIEIEEDL